MSFLCAYFSLFRAYEDMQILSVLGHAANTLFIFCHDFLKKKKKKNINKTCQAHVRMQFYILFLIWYIWQFRGSNFSIKGLAPSGLTSNYRLAQIHNHRLQALSPSDLGNSGERPIRQMRQLSWGGMAVPLPRRVSDRLFHASWFSRKLLR